MNKNESILPDGSRLEKFPGVTITSEKQHNSDKFNVYVVTDDNPDKRWKYKTETSGTIALQSIIMFTRILSKNKGADAANISTIEQLFKKENIPSFVNPNATKKQLNKCADNCLMCSILKNSALTIAPSKPGTKPGIPGKAPRSAPTIAPTKPGTKPGTKPAETPGKAPRPIPMPGPKNTMECCK